MIAAILATAFFPLSPLVQLVNPAGVAVATLQKPVAYDIFAPLSTVLDTLTLFSPTQAVATFVLAAVVCFGSRVRRQRASGTPVLSFDTFRFTLRFLGCTLALLELVVFLPRPMARLSLSDKDALAVDFHSHTAASHDGRQGFGAEANREWHARAGFNAAYVTDHNSFEGALAGSTRNPSLSGEGTVLLPGIELRNGDQHVLVIGADPLRTRVGSPDLRDAHIARVDALVSPLVLLSMPGNDATMRSPNDGAVTLGGVEVSDGSPRGLSQTSRDEDALLNLRYRYGLAPLSGSDNHGWGRTAPAWTVVRIPGWRQMPPGELDRAIRARVILDHGAAMEVVARRRLSDDSSLLENALVGPSAVLLMLRTLDPAERLSWTGWTALLAIPGFKRNRNRSRALSLGRFLPEPKEREPLQVLTALESAD